jgi:hypothetical protein
VGVQVAKRRRARGALDTWSLGEGVLRHPHTLFEHEIHRAARAREQGSLEDEVEFRAFWGRRTVASQPAASICWLCMFCPPQGVCFEDVAPIVCCFDRWGLGAWRHSFPRRRVIAAVCSEVVMEEAVPEREPLRESQMTVPETPSPDAAAAGRGDGRAKRRDFTMAGLSRPLCFAHGRHPQYRPNISC